MDKTTLPGFIIALVALLGGAMMEGTTPDKLLMLPAFVIVFGGTMGGYSPTMGIIGTVMGLVHVLENLSEPDKLGPLIASAFLATLYGIFFANALFLPIGSKLKVKSADEAHIKQLIVEGVLAVQSG